ncbi:hypothetical protein E2K99_22430 [Herbaspirillum huttiense]|uniref:hypothetical protein n=1 Tax=Herbaspirillum huttiense TaxID=863372 RepID=UPI0010654903|nr:hypothetical protein [Herbaspirillum huttiense]QBP77578.1 hypothetical protein E2K99_22430 [Herbaspirillum huttiense]
MIGYKISYKDLKARVDAHSPSWMARASTRTAGFISAGKYEETASIWSEIKSVYMRLQGEGKCIFCERKLESEQYGKGEQDVEHFRPKGRVRAWKVPASLKAQGVKITNPGLAASGYYRLPYHLFNYGVACKPCNSALKSDCFPIARTYDFDGDDPDALLSELPLLIYPIGDFDNNPEDLIEFAGASPHPIQVSGYGRDRAQTTIEFFALADTDARKNLFRERAIILIALWGQLEAAKSSTNTKAVEAVRAFQSENSAHANCARSFVRLYKANRSAAEGHFNAALDFVIASS